MSVRPFQLHVKKDETKRSKPTSKNRNLELIPDIYPKCVPEPLKKLKIMPVKTTWFTKFLYFHYTFA